MVQTCTVQVSIDQQDATVYFGEADSKVGDYVVFPSVGLILEITVTCGEMRPFIGASRDARAERKASVSMVCVSLSSEGAASGLLRTIVLVLGMTASSLAC